MDDSIIEDALSREELDNLKPPTEDMFKLTKRSEMWYEEAPRTAAALFVEACEQSENFRESFVNKEMVERVSEDYTFEVQGWRSLIDHECPDVAERLWGIGLSANQGGFAEQMARRYLEDD